MRMYFDLLMDRPITEEHYISPGGFDFVFNGKSVQFDFTEHRGGRDTSMPRVYSCELRDLDTDCFPEAEILYEEGYLDHIERIEEFYLYVGEDDEPEINLERIENIVFTHDGKDYPVPQAVIREFNIRLAKELDTEKER